MGMVPGSDIHSKSLTHSPEFSDQPVWLGGVGQSNIPFTSVMKQVEKNAKTDNISYVGVEYKQSTDMPVDQNPPVTQNPTDKFEKILATLDCDEIKTLRKIKIDAIRDAMNSGNQDALHQAQAEFKACSQTLRLRASTLGLTQQPGISVVSAPLNMQQTPIKADTNVESAQPAKTVEASFASKNDTINKTINNQLQVATNKGSESENIVNMQTISAINNVMNNNTNIGDANISNITPNNKSDAIYPTGNNRFGVSPVVWEAIQKNDSVKNTLLTFPLEAVDMYKTTTFDEKRLLFEQLQDKTKVMFVTVDHKDAFIKGSAYGHNTFDFFKSKIEEELKAGKLTKDVADKRCETVEVFRGMSQEQRKAFVDLLELDMKMAKI